MRTPKVYVRDSGLLHALLDIHDQAWGRRRGEERARQRVDEAKQALGERGTVRRTDGAPDWNRHLARNTPYAVWFALNVP